MNKRKMDDKRAEELFEAERALAFVDPGAWASTRWVGASTLYSGEGLLKLAGLKGRLVALAAAWACGGLVEEYIAGGVEE
jgi:hypothetical protein